MEVKCKNCGANLTSKQNFCPSCGTTTTKKERQKTLFIGIGIIIIIVVVISLLIIFLKKDKNLHDLSSSEVVEYLKDNGCDFDISDYTYIYTTHYVYVSCENPKIAFQKIDGSALNTIRYNWQLDSLNDSWADILETDKNEKSEEKKAQYIEYEKWLKNIGLTSSQIINALDYYDDNN
jgi:predicted nucleic acid-binding Zn ribbon protein